VRAAAVHALVLRDNPAFETDIVPLLDDKTEGVRLRAAAGYLRLETVRTSPKVRKRPVKGTGPKPQV
jgi:HEAT repeat protein